MSFGVFRKEKILRCMHMSLIVHFLEQMSIICHWRFIHIICTRVCTDVQLLDKCHFIYYCLEMYERWNLITETC